MPAHVARDSPFDLSHITWPAFHVCFALFCCFLQGILAATLSSELTYANHHRLGAVAHAGEGVSHARNANVAGG